MRQNGNARKTQVNPAAVLHDIVDPLFPISVEIGEKHADNGGSHQKEQIARLPRTGFLAG